MTDESEESRAGISPTLMSLGNGLCGLASITFATSAGADAGELRPIALAGVMILVAMVFDMLDGRLARMTGRTSRFGVELDSLCDMVSFGVAPVFVMLACTSFRHPVLLWMVGGAYTASAALRLARFNAEHDGSKSAEFRGLPSPAAAGNVASIAIALPILTRLSESAATPWVLSASGHLLRAAQAWLPAAMVLLGVLMISRVPYPHPMEQLSGGRILPIRLLPFVVAALAFAIGHELALPLLFGAYALMPSAHFVATHLAGEGELYAR
jgi:CDP-diacylglycerol--serine O-phosphatidyltransferase